VSYVSDSPEHDRAVREFATFLREQAGVDARLDVWSTGVRRDWTSWTIEQLRQADFVLAIASPQYKRIADGRGSSAPGKAKVLEAAMLRDDLVGNSAVATRRILPVLLPGHVAGEIPECLCGNSTTHYVVSELTLSGVRSLLAALAGTPLHEMPPLAPFVPPDRGLAPVVVGTTGARKRTPRVLSAANEVEIGPVRYLVHGDTLEVRPSQDGTAVARRARALRISPPSEYVWLSQVELRQETAAADSAARGLTRERELLRELQGRDPGFPRIRGFVRESGTVTLVTAWPESAGGPCETLAGWIPQRGEVIDRWRTRQTLHGLAGLCRTLAALHGRGATHRLLTPAGLLRFDDGRLMLRDLGLAGTAYRPGEGPDGYQAAEQRVRSNGPVGPWTDVYQVAALAYHLVTGFPPDPAIPLPVRGTGAGIQDRAAAAIDAGLVVVPERRPDLRTLAEAFRAVHDRRL
jgi:hypothetical protein